MMKELIDDIKANRCILFIGPQMRAFEENGSFRSHSELYCQYIFEQLTINKTVFDGDAVNKPYYLAGKFLDGSDEKSKKEGEIMEKIYMNRKSDIYENLAIIPFNTIFNFGFDHFINRAIEAKGYEFEFAYYNYKGPEIENLNVDAEMQLLYNLFGSFNDDPLSIVKNEKQQLEFFRKINSSPKLPNDLLSRVKADMKGNKSYIFLGFDFNEWPFRFLLDTLAVPKAARCSITPSSSDDKIAIMNDDFYRDCFGIKFMKQTPESFMEELIKDYTKTSTNHQFGYISYDESDELIVNEFKTNLAASKITQGRKIQFFDRSMIQSGQIRSQVINANLNKATVHILFASPRSIVNNDIKMEVDFMIKKYLDNSVLDADHPDKRDILIFPIIIKNCYWRIVFNTLEGYSKIVLPGKNTVLKNSSREPQDTDYTKILEIINAKIR